LIVPSYLADEGAWEKYVGNLGLDVVFEWSLEDIGTAGDILVMD